MQANKTVEVFCSYAHEDESWLQELESHLSLLKRQGHIALWHDRLIVPGADWTKSIDIHLETASVILLLVSADFLASDYCYGIEMKRALERHQRGEAQVIPILIRQVDWKHAPFAYLRVLPTDAKPLALWENKDAGLADVSENLRRVIEGELLSNASASHLGLSSIWNVPYRRSPHFTGRDELLDQLHQQLIAVKQNDTAKIRGAALTQPQAVKGLGGIGKTQIAVEYAYRHCQDYQVVLWVRVDTHEALVSDYVEIAKLLNLPQKDDQDQTLVVQAVLQWFKTHTQWLLIFDNADDLSLVHTYLPRQGNGSIIITTRAHAIDKFGSIEVERMGLKEGREFLLNRTNRLEYVSDEERKKATDIVIVLDLLPLALDQAGAYIEETGCSFSDYLLVYQARRKELLARRGGYRATKEHPDSVATTFSLSFQKVEQANPSAAELLRLSAFLAPDKIPEELIRDCANLWSSPLQQAADLFAFNGMMEELLKYSLVNRLLDNKAFSIHRLVQAVQIDTMEKDMQCKWAERVIQAVNKVFPDNPEDVAVWSQCLRYLDQVQACNTLIEQYTLPLLEAADLLNRTGSYLKMQASYTMAEPLFKRALAIREQQVGSEHPDVAVALNGLAVLYFEQGKHAEAEPLFKQALAIWEELGQKHPNVAVALNGLASLYFMQGKYKEAEPLFKRAQRIMMSIPGQRDVAYSLNNLATLYQKQGKYGEAEPLFKRALSIREELFGPEHFLVATSFNNLAILYFEQGKHVEAESLLKRALAIREKMFGSEHPDVASSLNGLAGCYFEQGKYGEAEPLFKRALYIREQQLGPEHPDVAASLNDLAILYQQQGKYREAEPLFRQALAIREQQLGPRHLDVAASLNSLAILYFEQRKYAEAESLFKQALVIRKQQLGPEHSLVATSLNDLANLYQQQGKHREAEPLFRQALAIREQRLGSEHPDVASSLNGLAIFYLEQGKYGEAESLFKQALAISERVLGSKHSQTQTLRENYDSLRRVMERDTKGGSRKRFLGLF